MSGTVKLLIGCAVLAPLLVCCLGVLASTAIPAFLRYTLRSKAAEAPALLQELSGLVTARCQRGDPPVTAGPLPGAVSSERHQTDYGADPGFSALGFNPAGPLYYQYAVLGQPDGSSVLRARGDLDGDGLLSTYEITCASSCACSPLFADNELE